MLTAFIFAGPGLAVQKFEPVAARAADNGKGSGIASENNMLKLNAKYENKKGCAKAGTTFAMP